MNRDLTDVDAPDRELDAYLERRARDHRVKPQEPSNNAWEESERRHRARRESESRLRWAHHRAAAERHKAVLASLVAHHEQEAQRYLHDMEQEGRAS